MRRLIACTVDILWRIFIFVPLLLGTFVVWEMLEGHEAMPATGVRKIIQRLVAVLLATEGAISRFGRGFRKADVVTALATVSMYPPLW